MRFNDLMQTVLASSQRGSNGATTLWRQCIDILAQYDRADAKKLSDTECETLLSELAKVRPSITEAQRIASVVELGKRMRSPSLVRFFAGDRPSVCVAAMVRANLPDDTWPKIMGQLTPTARGILRSRRDLGTLTLQSLHQYGKIDLLLSNDARETNEVSSFLELTPEMKASSPDQGVIAPVTDKNNVGFPKSGLSLVADRADAGVPESVDQDRSQIRELVERIERYTSIPREKGDRLPFSAPPELIADAPRHFPFETDANGNFIWVGDASRAALVGLSIAEPALPGSTGADGSIAGAFGRRSSFQLGRYWIADGPYSGEWRLSAIPFFDQRSGRFQGYRGQARRPHLHEVPYAPAQPKEGAQLLTADSMRQLVHELRTPLNAILGFAEIIEQQLFGPTGIHYREMAGHILVDARRLLGAFDDLDLAARSSAASLEAESDVEAVALEPLIERVTTDFDSAAQSSGGRQVHIRLTAAADLPPILINATQGERMLQHLMRTLVSVSQVGDALQGSAWFQPDGDGGRVIVGFDRPAKLRGMEEAQLLDPAYGSEGELPDAPLLGLGFSLRLVRSLAQAQNGEMLITPERIMLSFPVANSHADDEAAST
jgi:His Kinase A (phospho-acceptor) domain